MSLIITNSNNFFELTGTFNEIDVKSFQKVLRKALASFQKVTISIENVQSMDRHGVNAISQIHEEAINKCKSLSIIGYGCKDLYNHFKSSSAA